MFGYIGRCTGSCGRAARSPSTTFLPGRLVQSCFLSLGRVLKTRAFAAPDELRKLLEDSGFTVTAWSVTTDAGRAWFVSVAERIRKEGLPPLGFHILLGPEFQDMAQNRNLEEGRIVLAQVGAKR